MDRHVHSFHEIGYVVAGRGRYETPSATVSVGRGSLLVWSGRLPHRAVDQAGDPLHQVIVVIDDEVLIGRSFYPILRELFQKGEPAVFDASRLGPGVEVLIRRLASEGRLGGLGTQDMLAALVVELCVALCRKTVDPLRAATNSDVDSRIASVLRDMDTRYYHALGPESYSRTLGISVRRFSELFRKGTGKTFTEYLTDIRIAKAKAILLETDHRVINIAFEVGYENLSHFNRTFKKITACSPQEFRKTQGALP